MLIDVVSIPKTNENFRLLYDTKGRFRLHSVRDEEAKVCNIDYMTFDWDLKNNVCIGLFLNNVNLCIYTH